MIFNALNYLTTYLGTWGTGLLSTLLFIAMVRIGIAFVFKLFRMNINYRSLQNRDSKLTKKGY